MPELTVVRGAWPPPADLVDDLGDDDLVLCVDDAELCLVDVDELAARFVEEIPAPALASADGRAAIGTASAARDGTRPALDVGSMLFQCLPAQPGEVLVIGGALRNVIAGSAPVVAVGDDAEVQALAERIEASTGDGLATVLGYDGAAREPMAARSIGPDLLVVPFWTAEMCSAVIRAAEAVDAWGADPDDPVPGDEVSLATISPRLFAHVEDHVAAAVIPALHEHWPLVDFVGLQDAFVIRYTPARAVELRLHHDVAQVSGSLKLNDGYEGAVLEFPRQQVSNAELGVGDLLCWPSLVTHPHRATPLLRGVKYGLTMWFRVPGTTL